MTPVWEVSYPASVSSFRRNVARCSASKSASTGGKPQRFAVKHEIVLLAAQRHEVETERLSGRPGRDAAVGFTGQHRMGGRQ